MGSKLLPFKKGAFHLAQQTQVSDQTNIFLNNNILMIIKVFLLRLDSHSACSSFKL